MAILGCTVAGCPGRHKARGYCTKHYRRWQTHGTVDPQKGSREPAETRFSVIGWTVVEGGCWEWSGHLNEDGYGVFRPDGGSSMTGAHRFSYLMNVGEIPDGLVVRHRCDNPPCVNPSHLTVGTVQSNVADSVERGRRYIRYGLKNHKSKITFEDATEIRRKYSSGGVSQQSLAEEFGISQVAVSHIVRGKTWTRPE